MSKQGVGGPALPAQSLRTKPHRGKKHSRRVFSKRPRTRKLLQLYHKTKVKKRRNELAITPAKQPQLLDRVALDVHRKAGSK